LLLELVSLKKETSSNAYEFTGTRGKTKNFVFFPPSSPESDVVVVVISLFCVCELCVVCCVFQKRLKLFSFAN